MNLVISLCLATVLTPGGSESPFIAKEHIVLKKPPAIEGSALFVRPVAPTPMPAFKLKFPSYVTRRFPGSSSHHFVIDELNVRFWVAAIPLNTKKSEGNAYFWVSQALTVRSDDLGDNLSDDNWANLHAWTKKIRSNKTDYSLVGGRWAGLWKWTYPKNLRTKSDWELEVVLVSDVPSILNIHFTGSGDVGDSKVLRARLLEVIQYVCWSIEVED